jgi:hypothetical protein
MGRNAWIIISETVKQTAVVDPKYKVARKDTEDGGKTRSEKF